MAWVARTSRPELFDTSSTPSAVGPGAYALIDSSIKVSGASFAPFSCTSHREVVDQAASTENTPGPGRYDANQGISRKHTHRSVFVDQTTRFQQPTNENPGPGSYKQPGSVARTKTRSFPKKTKGSIEFVRTAPVPSIPHNSFGFQEDHGLLIPQGPFIPKVEHSYEPPSSLDTQHHKMDFSKSKTQRSLWQKEMEKQRVKPRTAPSIPRCFNIKQDGVGEGVTPGPGVYQTEHIYSIGGLKSNIAGDSVVPHSSYQKYKPSAIFLKGMHSNKDSNNTRNANASIGSIPHKTVLLDQKQEKPREEMFLPKSVFDKAAQVAPQEKQFFASKTQRAFELADPHETPGPGAYDAKKEGYTFSRQQGCSMFVDQSDRFQDVFHTRGASVIPGPGAYNAQTIGKKVFNRNSTFGSTSSRFAVESDVADQSHQGPGMYVSQPDYVEKEKSGLAFSTKTTKLTYKPDQSSPRKRLVTMKDSDAAYRIPTHGYLGSRPPGITDKENKNTFPPVGSYNIDIDGQKRNELVNNPMNRNFNTKAPRFQTNQELKETLLKSHLGPGRYDHHQPTQQTHPSFNRDVRFEKSHLNKVPGVGMYETAPASLLKKSYNITIQ